MAWSELSRESFDEAYWTTLWRWYYGEGGNGHVAAYLASLDISGFDPKAPPRKTQAFWEIVDASRPRKTLRCRRQLTVSERRMH